MVCRHFFLLVAALAATAIASEEEAVIHRRHDELSSHNSYSGSGSGSLRDVEAAEEKASWSGSNDTEEEDQIAPEQDKKKSDKDDTKSDKAKSDKAESKSDKADSKSDKIESDKDDKKSDKTEHESDADSEEQKEVTDKNVAAEKLASGSNETEDDVVVDETVLGLKDGSEDVLEVPEQDKKKSDKDNKKSDKADSDKADSKSDKTESDKDNKKSDKDDQKSDKAESDKADSKSDKTESDKDDKKSDKAESDKADKKSDKSESDKADKAKSDKADSKSDKTESDKDDIKSDKAKSDKAKSDKADSKSDKADSKSDKADSKSDKADSKSDKAKSDKAESKSDKADSKSDKIESDKDKKSDKTEHESDADSEEQKEVADKNVAAEKLASGSNETEDDVVVDETVLGLKNGSGDDLEVLELLDGSMNDKPVNGSFNSSLESVDSENKKQEVQKVQAEVGCESCSDDGNKRDEDVESYLDDSSGSNLEKGSEIEKVDHKKHHKDWISKAIDRITNTTDLAKNGTKNARTNVTHSTPADTLNGEWKEELLQVSDGNVTSKDKKKKSLTDDAIGSFSIDVGDTNDSVESSKKVVHELEKAKNATEDVHDSVMSPTEDAVGDVEDFVDGSGLSSCSGPMDDTANIEQQQLGDESVAFASETAEKPSHLIESAIGFGAFVGIVAVALAFAVRLVRTRVGSGTNEDEAAVAMAAENSGDDDTSEDEDLESGALVEDDTADSKDGDEEEEEGTFEGSA